MSAHHNHFENTMHGILGCSEVKMCFCRYMQGKKSLDNKLICAKTNRVAVYRARRVFVMRCTKYIPADNAHEGTRQYLVIYTDSL